MIVQEAEKFTPFRDAQELDYSSEGEKDRNEETLAPKESRPSRTKGVEARLPSPETQVAVFQSPMGHVPQRSEENFESSNMPTGTETQSKRKRGPTKLTWLFGSKTVLKLEWDDRDRVVGPGKNAVTFTEAIGVLLKICPHIQWTLEWPQVVPDAKNWIWDQLMNKFELDMFRKDKVMRLYGGSAFRNKKKQWKAQYYKPYETDEERLLDKPDELSEAQWVELVHFWGTTEQQKKARQNEINRSKLEIKHTTGRISFPRTIHEMEVADGERPSQGRLFEVTHTSKRTRDALDNVSKNYISKMRALAGTNEQGTPLPLTDEHYHQVMPPERHGRVRGQGPGVTPTSYFGCSSYKGSSGNMEKNIQEEIDRRVEEKTKELESRLEEQMMEKLQAMMTKQFHSKDMTGSLENCGNETILSPQVPYSQQYHEKGALKKCKLVNWQKMVVAEGRLESTNPNALVHHILLGPDIWKVWVDVAVDPKASLWRMTSEMSNIEHAVGTTVAWHKDYICLD